MPQFKRGIKQEFLDLLNIEYRAGGWWKAIADDRDFFIAIRKDYINVYLNGNSLIKFWQKGEELIGETHYKYLLAPDSARPYVKVIGGKTVVGDVANLFMDDLSDLAGLKRSLNVYTGNEKKGIHQVVMSNPNVVDVEIAFGAENEEAESNTAIRIDFAILRLERSGPTIVFYEGKLFANKELRSAGENVPVLEQLRRYEKFLRDEQAALIDSYRTVCSNLAALEGVKDRYLPMLDIMRDLPSLSVCEDMRLVVFGFDADQKSGANWSEHRRKLEAVLGDRFLLKGDAKKFTKGISS